MEARGDAGVCGNSPPCVRELTSVFPVLAWCWNISALILRMSVFLNPISSIMLTIPF